MAPDDFTYIRWCPHRQQACRPGHLLKSVEPEVDEGTAATRSIKREGEEARASPLTGFISIYVFCRREVMAWNFVVRSDVRLCISFVRIVTVHCDFSIDALYLLLSPFHRPSRLISLLRRRCFALILSHNTQFFESLCVSITSFMPHTSPIRCSR